MLEIETTAEYDRWISRLRDTNGRQRITRYFEKLQNGNAITGDYKSVGDKVIEVRFNVGPGYRVYLSQEGRSLVLLLVGGDKSTQERDIKRAKELARQWRRERSHEDA